MEFSAYRVEAETREGAIALSLNAAIATRNHKDFGLVPGLSIVDWTA